MLLSLVLSLSVAQSPELRGPVVVLVSSRRAGAEQVAGALATEVRGVIERESATPSSEAPKGTDARGCNAAAGCLRELAKKLGPHAVVVGVDAGKAGKSIAVHLEAVAADTAESLAVADFLVSAAKWKDQTGAAVTVFGRNVVEKLALPAASHTSTPTTEASNPPPTPPASAQPRPVEPPRPPSAKRSAGPSGQRVVAWVSAAAALAAAGTSGPFLVLGLQDKAFVDRNVVNGVSLIPQTELEGRASQGNTRFTIALVCAAAALAFAVLSAVLFATD